METRRQEFDRAETTVVVTADAVARLPVPVVLAADRWGEILYLATASDEPTFRFPHVDELLSWVQFAEIQCPECPP